MLQRAAQAAAPLLEDRKSVENEAIPKAEKRLANARNHTWRSGQWGAPTVVIVTVLSLVWIYLFSLLRSLDVMMLTELGYAPTGAAALGTLVALVMSVIGVGIAALLGVHRLPAVAGLRLTTRAVLIVVLVQGAVLLLWQLPSIAETRSLRSPELGGRVATLTKVVADLESEPTGDPVELAAARTDLADAQERLDRARKLDRTVATAVPVAEMALSSTPLFAIEFILIGCAAATVAGRRRTVRLLNRRIGRISAAEIERISGFADGAGIPPREVEEWIARHTGPGGGSSAAGTGTSSHAGAQTPPGDNGTTNGNEPRDSEQPPGDDTTSSNGHRQRRRSGRAASQDSPPADPDAAATHGSDSAGAAAGWDELASNPNHQEESE
jgi:hypothetical protein